MSETTNQEQNTAAEEAGAETALEIAPKYNPLAPVGDPQSMKALLERNSASIKSLLPRHVTPERVIKTMLVAVNRNPALLRCTQASVFETIQRTAELGLDLSGTLGEAYPVPFNNKVKTPDGREVWVEQCTLIIGYRGLAKLARQSGEIKRIESEVVYEKDTFIYQKGTDFRLEFKPDLGDDRGKKLGVYALVEFRDGGLQADFMTVQQVEAVRAKAKSKNSPAWRDHWDEMAKKTAFRRLAKWLPLAAEKFNQALEQDAVDFDFGDLAEGATVEIEQGSRTAALAERLGGGSEEETPEQEPAADKEKDPNAKLAPRVVTRLRALAEKQGVDLTEVEELYGDALKDLPASSEAEIEAEIRERGKAAKGGKR